MLTRLQLLRAVVFVGSVASVYAVALYFLLDARKRRPHSRRFVLARRCFYLLAVVGLLCMIYGRWVEPRRLDITHVRLTTASLPPGSSLRIVHLSDLHCEAKPILETKLPGLIAAEKP